MGLSAYETSSHLAMIVALVVVYGAVLGGAVVCGWSWLRRHWRSVGFARRRWDRTGPVGTVGRAG